MDVEVLLDHRELHSFANSPEVVERAAEELRLGENRDGRRPAALELGGPTGVERVIERALGRRTTLELGDDRYRRAPKCRTERLPWGPGISVPPTLSGAF